MKQIILILFLITIVQNLFSQRVGIGTNSPDQSAMLDINSVDGGLLIPRMSSTDRQNIIDPAKGLMVYDTTSRAFYYFTGNGWLELLAGNVDKIVDADGDTKIQVEESADEDMIRFDLDGTEYFTLKQGRINVLNTGSSVFIGEAAGQSDDLTSNANVFIGEEAGAMNTSGHRNVGVGYHAMGINVGGNENTVVGYNILPANTSGSANVAMGFQNLLQNTTGGYNTAIGYGSLAGNSTGHSNTGLGARAGINNQTGTRNVLIGASAGEGVGAHSKYSNVMVGAYSGYRTNGNDNTFVGTYAGYENDGNKNVFIGYDAGAFESGSNKLIIENSDVDSSQALIYGEFDNHWVRINGRLTPAQGISDADGDTRIQVEESPDEDQIRFDIKGHQAMWLGANGNLNLRGLSTVTNLALLKDSTSYSSNVIFQGSGTQYQLGTPNADRFRIWLNTTGEVMSILPNGNIGVRVAGPQANFHVNGSIRSSTLLIADTTRTALILKTDDNSADMGLAYRNVGGNFNWNIYRSDAGNNAAHLVIAGGPQHTDVTDLPERMRILSDGRVAIGTEIPASGYLLSVGGKMIAEELKIRLQANWPDYVFDKSYGRMSLQELQEFIDNHHHLPNIPSAAEIAENDGIEVGEMQRLMMEKIEEMTLYILELKNEIDELKTKIN